MDIPYTFEITVNVNSDVFRAIKKMCTENQLHTYIQFNHSFQDLGVSMHPLYDSDSAWMPNRYQIRALDEHTWLQFRMTWL